MGPFLLGGVMSFVLSKIFAYTMLPPGIFIFLGIILFFLIIKDKKRWAIFFLSIILIGMYFISIEPGMNSLVSPLEEKYPPLDIKALPDDVDAVVILGGGLTEGRSPYPGESLYPRQFTVSRLIYGYTLWKELMVPIIVSGGNPLMSLPGTEADTMKAFLMRLGVPENFIITEKRSRNTWENALYTAEICKNSDFKKIVLVTPAYHLMRAMVAFSKYNLNIYPAPSSYLTNKRPYVWTSFLPHADYLYYSFIALKERMGLLFYKIFPK